MEKSTSLTIVAEGTGYLLSTSGKLVGGTFTAPTVFRVESVGAVSAAVAAGGAGYTVGDDITLVGGVFGTAAVFNVDAVTGGVVDTVSLVSAGDYSAIPADPVATTGGTGTGATLNVTFGSVKALLVVDAGSYTVIPSSPVSVSGAGGAGLTVRAVFAPFFTGAFQGGRSIKNDGLERTGQGPSRAGSNSGRVSGDVVIPRAISGGTPP